MNNPALAVIRYAINLDADDAQTFLLTWYEGNFPEIRKYWENVPEEVFIGADPEHPETKRMREHLENF